MRRGVCVFGVRACTLVYAVPVTRGSAVALAYEVYQETICALAWPTAYLHTHLLQFANERHG